MNFPWPKHNDTDTSAHSATQNAWQPIPRVVSHMRSGVEPYARIEHADDLPAFQVKLYDVISMRPSLRHRVCPIDVSPSPSGKVFALILLQDEFNTDVHTTVVAQMMEKGWAQAHPACYIAPASVLLDLARDGINSVTRKVIDGINTQADGPLWQLFEGMGEFALMHHSSDIHFCIDRSSARSQVSFRIEGKLTSPRQFEIETLKLLDMVAYLYNVHGKSGSEGTFNENQPQQCQINTTIKGKNVLFRWASNKTALGTKVVMRVIPRDTASSVWTLTQHGYLPAQQEIFQRAIGALGGGVLVGGIVGSGKSKLLQTLLAMLPKHMAKYTIEDPVENYIPGADQFSVSRSLAEEDGDPFIVAKRQTKRMDPDAVMIGEIRDRESASMFLDIAGSGHRAFSSVHAPSAFDMLTVRLSSEDFGIPRETLATPGLINLLAYLALVPKLCGNCKLPAKGVLPPEYLERIQRLFDIAPERINTTNCKGCEECRRNGLPELNGLRGRQVVAEMIEPNTTMLAMLRDGKSLELQKYVRSTRFARFDEADTTGKTALEVAMYFVAAGELDPREVEEKFGSFTKYELDYGRGSP